MIGSLGYGPNYLSLGTNTDLRQYARWEYGNADAEWMVATTRRNGHRLGRSWALRLRYWLNSFRGFAAFDVRGMDGRA